VSLDITRVIVAGHSAGGQLALWASARHNGRRSPGGPIRIRPRAVAGLAAILDLRALFAAGGGNHAVRELLGGSPAEQPARYAAASPAALLPLGVPQLIIHGTEDDTLPVEVARDYARAATSAGDSIQFRELAHVGHMDYLDPSSDAHDALCDWLEVASS
jgi:pimeloyl-ACP methyl ester carboxylesterase